MKPGKRGQQMKGKFSGCFAVLALWATLAGASSLGRISGEIRLSPVAPGSPVAGYLSQHPAGASTPSAVKLYPPGSASAHVATGAYTLASGAQPPMAWRFGTFSLNPSVEDTGSVFQIEVDAVPLGPGAFYRFGARSVGLGSLITPAVLPLPAATAGTTFDITERPCLTRMRVRLTGTNEVIDALDETQPFVCTASALAPEAAGVLIQAKSVRGGLHRDVLRNTDVVLELLFRDQADVQREVACTTRPPQGSNFMVNNEGDAVFFGRPRGPATGSCGNVIEQDFDIPVRRDAGALTGYFDVNGETETDALIVAARNNVQPRTVAPTLVPAGQVPAAGGRWRITGLVPAEYDVYAYARLRGGDAFSILPHRAGANLPVNVGAVPPDVDLGSTFITRSAEATGKLLIIDPSGQTELSKLATEPLPMSSSPWLGPWSFLKADGLDQIPVGGGSGESAVALGRLRGPVAGSLNGCSANPRSCLLDYTLLLTGLSAPDAPLDGSGTRTTLYEFGGVNFSYGTPATHFQQSFAKITRAESRLVAGPNPAPIALDRMGACLGQIDYRMQVNGQDGNLFLPLLSGNGTVSSANTAFTPSLFSDVSLRRAEGLPKSAASATPVARALATLPEGARYRLTPQVTFAPAGGGTATNVTLPARHVPTAAGSVLGCGQIVGVCEKINNPATGESTLLSISIGDQPQCRPDNRVSMSVSVASGGENVNSLTYSINGGPETSLCGGGSCGADPTRPLPAQGGAPLQVPAGGTVTVRASSQNGCDTTYTYTAPPVCMAPVLAPRYQLGFFDEGHLKVRDIVSNTVVADVPRPPGALRFSRDGGMVAVVSNTDVRVLDAENPASSVDVYLGSHADAAFSPADGRMLALLQGAPSGGVHTLNVVVPGNPNAPIIGPATHVPGTSGNIAPSVVVSRPKLAWSRDGTRITAAYVAGTAAGNRFLRTFEWRIANGQLSAVPQRDGIFPLARDEELRAFGYWSSATGDRYVVATSRRLYLLGPNGVLQPLPVPGPVNQADLHRDGLFAVAPGGTAPVQLVAELVIAEPGASGSLLGAGAIAVSDYRISSGSDTIPLLAVARRARFASGLVTPATVTIYALRDVSGQPALRVVGGFTATNPTNLAFRPAPP